jgi:hypothetical protein
MKAILRLSFTFLLIIAISCNQKSADEKAADSDSVVTKIEERIAAAIDTSKKQEEPHTSQTVPAGDTLTPQKVSIVIFNNDTTADAALKGYGYSILMDGKMYVHQPHIPAVPGNKGFASVADAKKAGALIKYKVEHHIMPPSVTVEELDSLKIKY